MLSAVRWEQSRTPISNVWVDSLFVAPDVAIARSLNTENGIFESDPAF